MLILSISKPKVILTKRTILIATCLFLSSCTADKTLNKNISPTHTLFPTIQIGLMGDVGLGRNVNAISRDKNDFYFVFEKMSPWLIQNDLNSINLESPIYQPCPTVRSSTFKFCGDTKFAPVLANYKIFANLANNHILNYGQDGLALTKKLLSDNMVDFVYSHQKSLMLLVPGK